MAYLFVRLCEVKVSVLGLSNLRTKIYRKKIIYTKLAGTTVFPTFVPPLLLHKLDHRTIRQGKVIAKDGINSWRN